MGGCADVGRFALGECIIKRPQNAFFNQFFAVEWYGGVQVEWKKSYVVQAKNVVGVFMRKQNCVGDANPFSQKLEA